jgi:CheY-like chemotaxis protein
MMQRQFGHMVRLVDDLLDISRVGSGKIELRREALTVQTIVAHAVEGSSALIQALGHQLDIATPDQPVWVHGDLTRLAQVLANLLNNAAKYTANGGRIALSVHIEEQLVAIRIADNGAGIPADMQARIFDLFAQVDNTLSQSHGGLGIGLSLARKLIDMHGGSITCESGGLGKGSTFTARLPLATVVATAASEVALSRIPAEAHAAAALVPGAAQRVLIVDDNEDAAEALAMMLQFSGCEAQTAHGGKEGLAASRSFRPDVIFLDIGLPGMNGYDVARQIRADPQTRDAFLIALTGWGSDEDRRLSSEAGFDLHLTKPVDIQALTSLLRDHARTEACPE